MYNIRFINQIFFHKYFNNNKNLDNIDIKKEKIKINIDEIIVEIKNEYKFLNINEEVLKNYLNYITDNNNEKDKENKNYC